MFCLDEFKQLDFSNQLSTLNNLSFQQPVKFLNLIRDNFDINSFIPNSFTNKYYSELGAKREYNLSSVLAALLLKHIFNIPTVSLLCIFMAFSSELRNFCMFQSKIPDESFFSHFKTTYESDILNLFDSMVPHIINICSEMNELLPDDSPMKNLNSNLIYDTSGLKPKVKENNPKTLASEINKQKSYAKAYNFEGFNPYAAAYKNMPKHSEANPNIKLDFVNGHFGYFYKFGLLTNGWGIPLKIHFFDDTFYSSVKSDFETPEDQKYEFDNASLKPVLSSFLESNSNFRFTNFLGDSEFDSYDNFGFLKSKGFEKVFIPLNPRNSTNDTSSVIPVDSNGIPLCPKDKKQFKSDGSCKGKNRSLRFKFVCPLSKKIKTNWICTCESPCRPTKSTVTSYKYSDKDFRLYPGILRNSVEWATDYKGRTIIERELSSLKKNPCIESPRTVNTTTMRSELYLAAISKLITVIVAYSINKPEFMRNTRNIMKFAA